jgi:phosphoribosylglycinamide formyltransferase-1
VNGNNGSCGVVALISGRGSNLQAILDAAAKDELAAEVRAVISNCPGVDGLERARRSGVPAITLDHKNFINRIDFETALMDCIDGFAPHLLVLAGFMRILQPAFVAHYQGRMLNIHPSLLPKYRGLQTHERALAAGEREHGASVHFVTPDLDAGPVIVQARVPVFPDDDPTTLADRVLAQEHRIYPLAVRWFAEKRIVLAGDSVLFDGQPLSAPKLLDVCEDDATL